MRTLNHVFACRKSAALAVALVALSTTSTLAGGQSSARSVAMGGAQTALATGVSAVKYNPANLGLSNHQKTNLELIGVGASLVNNTFTLDDYNKYTGAFLTDDDKSDILDKVPAEGMKLSLDAEATAMGFSSGNVAFATSGVGTADINLSKDLLDLVLNGNTFADSISVNGSYSDVMSYASAGLSYGFPIYSNGSRQLAVGATFKYFYGIAVEEVTKMHGVAATYAAGFQGEGEMVARTATGGRGYGLDLGVALAMGKNYTIGAQLENAIGTIKWNRETEEHGYLFNFDTMTVDNADEDYITSDDYSKSINDFSTTLPRTLTLGIANTTGSFVWALDYEQGLSDGPGTSTDPRIGAGAEWSLISLLPLRAGFSTGGDKNTAFSFGSGLHFVGFYLDAAVVTGHKLSGYSAKGLDLAVSTGLQF